MTSHLKRSALGPVHKGVAPLPASIVFKCLVQFFIIQLAFCPLQVIHNNQGFSQSGIRMLRFTYYVDQASLFSRSECMKVLGAFVIHFKQGSQFFGHFHPILAIVLLKPGVHFRSERKLELFSNVFINHYKPGAISAGHDSAMEGMYVIQRTNHTPVFFLHKGMSDSFWDGDMVAPYV